MRIPLNINKFPETALFFCSVIKNRPSAFFNFNFPTSPNFYNSLYFNINLIDFVGEVKGEPWGKLGEVWGQLVALVGKVPPKITAWIITEKPWLGEVGKMGEAVFALRKITGVCLGSVSWVICAVKSLLFRVLRSVIDRSRTVYIIKGLMALSLLALLARCFHVGRVRRKERNYLTAQNYKRCGVEGLSMADINDLRGQDNMKGAIRNGMDSVLRVMSLIRQTTPLERFPKSGGNSHLVLVINWSTFLKGFFDVCVVFMGCRQAFLFSAGFLKVGGLGGGKYREAKWVAL